MSKDFNDNNMLHIKNGDVEYLKFKILEKYSDKINHVITLRYGGVSSTPYNSLNFRIAGNDKKENVFKNLEIISDKINIDKEKIYKGRQNHTDNILVINDENKEKYRFKDISDEAYDAYICNETGIATLVTTADCNPIIMYDPNKNAYANIHSGWKGTVKQIYLKTAKKMHEIFNSEYKDIIVCIGPSIRKCCFSSEDENFKLNFTNVWKDEEKYIYYEENLSRFHIDLMYVIRKDLIELGLKEENIVISDICTRCNKDDFFSYRYATQQKQKDYGTMATIVTLK